MSKPELIVDTNTVYNQGLASNPSRSAWVSANAGSGKTTVLSRRVVRLLLNGTSPSRILCLTFTKAAAGEMSNRVFSILGSWTSMDDAELKKELTDLEGKAPSPVVMLRARTLFAQALETPGGLKIQTIHAFCEALLHQFPLEANIPATFTVMDDQQQRQMLGQAKRSVILSADAEQDSPLGRAFIQIMHLASDKTIEKVFSEIISKREVLGNWLSRIGGPEQAEIAARTRFQFSPDDTTENLSITSAKASHFSPEILNEIAIQGRLTGKSNDHDLATRIEKFLKAPEDKKFSALCEVFLKSDGEPRKYSRFATQAIKDIFPTLKSDLDLEGQRLLAAKGRINSLFAIESTTPLLHMAQAVINSYHSFKRQRGLLDFDDLVSQTADLLNRKSASSWVLYKLDLGIDHILLDEAQDTSPRQWKIIDAFIEEFFSGASARTLPRTVFAVGDEKQSIYSFQGAEPRSFIQQRKRYKALVEGSGEQLEEIKLNLSFRSTWDVLGAVDEVFASGYNASGVSFDDTAMLHTAARRNDPGCVEVWPRVLAQKADDPGDWHTPQDHSQSSHQANQLAEMVADEISTMVVEGRLEASGKRIEPQDIIVLVRQRDRFMVALNRALKDRGVPVAGADRLAITNHIAVQDLMALCRVMLNAQDDLSLAAVLKSPILDLSEEDLFTLSRSRLRDGYELSLFEALRQMSETPVYQPVYDKLTLWRERADRMPVYEFCALLLGADGGRKAFYSRLGIEAEDVLDAFLDRTLSHEQNGLPGLQAFVEDLEQDAPEIKREMDAAAGEVRVMTVHAAKGLEAPIVFLVDKGSAAFNATHGSSFYSSGQADHPDGYLWVPKSAYHGTISGPLQEEQKRLAEEEYRRLLYVGMTRAKDKLVVCGYIGHRSATNPNWHTMVHEALEPKWQDCSTDDEKSAGRKIWRVPESVRDPKLANPVGHDEEVVLEQKEPVSLPGWINHQLPAETGLPRPLSPSGAHALIEEGLALEPVIPSLLADIDEPAQTSPAARGTAMHRLLQELPSHPRESWAEISDKFLRAALPDLDDMVLGMLMDGLFNTLNDPKLSIYFDPQKSRAEVPVMGRVEFKNGPRAVSGTIDRLAVCEDHVMLLDYKTSAYVPHALENVSADYVTQMALYRSLVEKIYPQLPVRAALLWTHASGGPKLMQLSQSAMDDALHALSV